MELALATLHQLCLPLLGHLDHLPEPQRDALSVAFGLRSGDPPDRFLVGLAVLSLIAEAAEERPLVCIVDDAQWLDRASAQTLAFVARRLLAESVALVFAIRDPSDAHDLDKLPRRLVEGLGDTDARTLLDSVLQSPLDERIRDRIVAESRGNPLALLELPLASTPADLAGGFGLPERPMSERIEATFSSRLAPLPADTRLLLLVAAAEPIGDPVLLWLAAERLGLGSAAAGPAVAAGLLELGARVRFRHPLIRSASYRAATAQERRRAHAALADAIGPSADPDRRAWHRARAASGPDEAVAEALERSAGRAQARGGVAATAAFLERAAELTPDLARRGARTLAAAQAKFEAGAPEAAFGLLAMAEPCPLDDLQRARMERLRAQLVFAARRGRDAPPLLLQAAARLTPLDAALARETYLEALAAAIFAGRLGDGRGVHGVAEAARAAPPAPDPPRAMDLLLDGLVTRFTEGYAAAVDPLARALEAFGHPTGGDQHWLWLACRVAPELWDDESWHELSTLQLRLARDVGALSILPLAATYRAGVHVHAGEFAEAAALIEEARAFTEATGHPALRYTSLVHAAWQGDEERAVSVIVSSLDDAAQRGEGRAMALADYASAVLYNGLGRPGEALAAAQRVCAHDELGLCSWAMIELIEAAAHSDAPDAAAEGLRWLVERTQAVRTDWALGIEARSRALLSEGPRAEAEYRTAIERLARSRIAIHLARAHLLYGEWLRREGRRQDAREQLRTAHQQLTASGIGAFAARAERELRAAGERARTPVTVASGRLTAQEAQIARLAADGLSNPEIGARLYISARTVQYHLHKVFAKLGIGSRSEIGQVLSPHQRAATPPKQTL